jgi:hypothetical protein
MDWNNVTLGDLLDGLKEVISSRPGLLLPYATLMHQGSKLFSITSAGRMEGPSPFQ